jgi:hypothetical protein
MPVRLIVRDGLWVCYWSKPRDNTITTRRSSSPLALCFVPPSTISHLRIRLTVKYFSVFDEEEGNPLPPHDDTIITKDIDILKADNVGLPAGGANVPTDRGTWVELLYEVRSGTHSCVMINGTAQEMLTNRFALGIPQPDSGWIPIAPSPTFRLLDGCIVDTHGAIGLSDPIWNALANGSVLSSATQKLRIIWADACFSPHFNQELGSVNITHRKVSATQWQVETN